MFIIAYDMALLVYFHFSLSFIGEKFAKVEGMRQISCFVVVVLSRHFNLEREKLSKTDFQVIIIVPRTVWWLKPNKLLGIINNLS